MRFCLGMFFFGGIYKARILSNKMSSICFCSSRIFRYFFFFFLFATQSTISRTYINRINQKPTVHIHKKEKLLPRKAQGDIAREEVVNNQANRNSFFFLTFVGLTSCSLFFTIILHYHLSLISSSNKAGIILFKINKITSESG